MIGTWVSVNTYEHFLVSQSSSERLPLLMGTVAETHTQTLGGAWRTPWKRGKIVGDRGVKDTRRTQPTESTIDSVYSLHRQLYMPLLHAIGYQIKSFVPGVYYFSFSCWSEESHSLPKQCSDLGYQTKLESKRLLLRTPYTWIIRQRLQGGYNHLDVSSLLASFHSSTRYYVCSCGRKSSTVLPSCEHCKLQ